MVDGIGGAVILYRIGSATGYGEYGGVEIDARH
jgi:hypothetical protein